MYRDYGGEVRRFPADENICDVCEGEITEVLEMWEYEDEEKEREELLNDT
jgi:hypothetical protein